MTYMTGTMSPSSLELHDGSIPMGKPTRSIPTYGAIADHLSPRPKEFTPLLGGYLDLSPPPSYSDSIFGLSGSPLPLESFTTLTKVNCTFSPFAPLGLDDAFALSPIDSGSDSELGSDENTPPTVFSTSSFCTSIGSPGAGDSGDIVPEPCFRFNRVPLAPLLHAPLPIRLVDANATANFDLYMKDLEMKDMKETKEVKERIPYEQLKQMENLALSIVNSLLDAEDHFDSALYGMGRLRPFAPPALDMDILSFADVGFNSPIQWVQVVTDDEGSNIISDGGASAQAQAATAATSTTAAHGPNPIAPPFVLTGPATIKDILARRRDGIFPSTNAANTTTGANATSANTIDAAHAIIEQVAQAALSFAKITTKF